MTSLPPIASVDEFVELLKLYATTAPPVVAAYFATMRERDCWRDLESVGLGRIEQALRNGEFVDAIEGAAMECRAHRLEAAQEVERLEATVNDLALIGVRLGAAQARLRLEPIQ